MGEERITWQGPSQRGLRDGPPDSNVFMKTLVPGSNRGLLTQRLGQESSPRVLLMPVGKLRDELHN